MSLLPRNHAQFRQKEYWESFFKRRGRRAFEWYGEYAELCGVLHKYSKPKEPLLVVGCGNSSLSADLHDVGYPSVVSVDVSEVAIRQMREMHARDRPGLRFELMDATDMGEFADGSFGCVVDKGTMDAIFPAGAEKDVVDKVDKMLEEIGRVLKVGGRYICISLLQPHILEHLVGWLSASGWPARVVRCKEVEDNRRPEDRSFPVFAVVGTKFRKMPTPSAGIFELCMSNSSQVSRLPSGEDLIDSVRGVQQFSAARAGLLKKGDGGEDRHLESGDARQEEVALELRDKELKEPKYSLYLTERQGHRKSRLIFGVFIVPQGREVEWLFSSAKGRQQLSDSADCGRLVVVHLNRSHDFPGGMAAVQEELSAYVMELAPSDLPPGVQVPFLSVSTDGGVGERRERSRGRSEMSGEFVVEDVEVDGDTFRRLIFLSNPNLTQSEAKLKKVKGKGGSKRKVVDSSYLGCAHHSLMIASVGLFPEEDNRAVRVLLVGLGGGGLATYMAKHVKRKIDIVVVEIDPTMGKVARDDFGFQEGGNLRLVIADGLEYIANFKGSDEERFDLVLFDVDSKDTSVGMSCPPKQFVSQENLRHIKERCLRQKGVFVLNLVCRDETLREETVADLGSAFGDGAIVSYKVPLEVNEVLYCGVEGASKKKVDSVHPLAAAFRATNALVPDKDFVDVTEGIKHLQMIR